MRRSGLRLVWAMASLGVTAGAAPAEAAPCLAVAVSALPQDRAALLDAMKGEQARRVDAWRAQGTVARAELLFTRGADAGVWDAIELLTFRDDAAMARWRLALGAGRDALAPEVLALARSVETSPCDEVRGGGPGAAVHPAVLIVPYVALIPPGEYLQYLDGYTIPQFKGWIEEGVLDSYTIVVSRFPAARAWNAMIFLRYRDDASLARRDEVVATVRRRLAASPAWKAYSDGKKAVRTEGRLAVADEIADVAER